MSVYRIVVDEVGIIIEQGQVAPYLFNDEGGLAVSEGIFGIDENALLSQILVEIGLGNTGQVVSGQKYLQKVRKTLIGHNGEVQRAG